MVDYAARLALAMKEANVDVTTLAQDVGITYQAVQKVLEGKSKGFNARNNTLVAKRLGIRSDWLATAQGAMRADGAPEHTLASEPAGRFVVRPQRINEIAVLGKAKGGLPERIWGDAGYPVGATDMVADATSTDLQAFVIEVDGTSMSPRYMHGEFALVEPNTDIDIEDDVLVRLTDGRTLLKRLLSRRGGITLGSYNDPEHILVNPSELSWMYYVVGPLPRKRIKHRV